MKGLIIDDEPHVRTVARLLVDWKKYGIHEVLEAGSAEEARELIHREAPAVILSDINLPSLSGLDLIEELRTEDIPSQIVLITAYGDFSYAQRALRLGCVDYLLKPLSEESLNEAVDKAIRIYKDVTQRKAAPDNSTIDLPSDTDLSARQSPPLKESETTPMIANPSMTISDLCLRVHLYLEHHFQEEISLDHLASLFNLSPGYLSRSYKRERGIGLIDDLTMIRLEEAKRLLAGPLRTADIAVAVGIPDPKYFSRVFKKTCRQTPAEYRESLKKGGK